MTTLTSTIPSVAVSSSTNISTLDNLKRHVALGTTLAAGAFGLAGVGFGFGKLTLGATNLSAKLGILFSASVMTEGIITTPCFTRLLGQNITTAVASKMTAHAIVAFVSYHIFPCLICELEPLKYSLFLSFGIPVGYACLSKSMELIAAQQGVSVNQTVSSDEKNPSFENEMMAKPIDPDRKTPVNVCSAES